MTTFAFTNPPLATTSPTLRASPAFTAASIISFAGASSLVEGSPSATFTFLATGRIFLTATALAPGSPVKGSPTIFSPTGATSIASASPIFGAPAFAQINLLQAAVLAPGSPAVAAAAFNQIQPLTGLGLAPSAPVITSRTLGLVGSTTLTAASLATSSPVFGVSLFFNVAPLIPRITAVAADSCNIVTLSQTLARLREVPGGTLAENVGRPPVIAVPVAPGAPVLGGSVLVATSFLAASGLATASPNLGTPLGVMTAANLTTASPFLDGPSLSLFVLDASEGFTPASPTLDAPTLDSITIAITALSLVTGQIGGVTGGGFLGLLFMGAGQPSVLSGLGSPDIGQLQGAGSVTTGSPVLGSPAILNNIYNFTAALAFTTGSPRFGTVILNNVNPHPQTTAVLGDAVGIATITQTGFRQTGLPGAFLDESLTLPAMTAAGLGGSTAAILGSPTLGQIQVLAAAGLIVGPPQLGTPFEFNPLGVASLAVGSPVLGAPALGKVLSGVGLTTTSPVLGTPPLAIASVTLVAASLATQAAVIGSQFIGTIGAPYQARPIETASPEIGAGVFTQRQLLAAAGVSTSSPVFTAPTLAAISHLTAASFAPAAALAGSPTLQSIDLFVAVGLLPGTQAEIGLPTLRQAQSLSAVGVVTFPPDIQTPSAASVVIVIHLNAASLTPASPAFTAPATGQLQTMIAIDLVDRVPQFSMATLGGTQLLDPFPGSIVTASPEIGVGDFVQIYPPGTVMITRAMPRTMTVTSVASRNTTSNVAA